ncbi:hypothetical protein AAVH_26526 [Aphelenchoides avenae]|nr:hypothetical protein AAVH_26526 [Aphelenchus avenae]
MTEEDCAIVGKLVDNERITLKPDMDAMVKAYVPSASADDVRGITSFFQSFDGRDICRRAISCGANFKCILRSVLQGTGATMLAIPELKMDGYKYCEECKAQMPMFRLAYMLDETKALMKQNALRTCASFHLEKLCVREVNAWFNTYYEEFVGY